MPESREDQREAVDAAVKALSKTVHAQVVMACRTGMTPGGARGCCSADRNRQREVPQRGNDHDESGDTGGSDLPASVL